MKRMLGFGIAAGLCAFTAAAQDDKPDQLVQKLKEEVSRINVLTTGNVLEGGVMSAVKGAPYSADQVTENTQTLGDGTRIHSERTVTVYRDGEGRVRRETPESISIWDPVAGVNYSLNPKTLTAHKMVVSVSVSAGKGTGVGSGGGRGAYVVGQKSLDAAGGDVVRTENMKVLTYATTASTADGSNTATWTAVGGGGVAGAPPLPPAIATMAPGNIVYDSQPVKFKRPVSESLGHQNMEGVDAVGSRDTRTIDTGEIGNDRPIQIVNERWFSQDLHTEIMSRSSDPRFGEATMHLSNIRRGEPDPSLFQVPPSYQIVEPRKVVFNRGNGQDQ